MSNYKSILITGASSGIGQAIALRFAKPGVSLALLGRDLNRLQKVASDCIAKGADVDTYEANVEDQLQMQKIINHVDAKRPLDCVIANAGISSGGLPMTPQLAKHIIEVNVLGVFNTIDPIIPNMSLRGYGCIAIMGSLAGYRGFPNRAVYSASKSAVKNYAEALGVQLKGDNIQVSLICPGFVKTPLTDRNKFQMPGIISVESAADIVVRGLEERKRLIAFPKLLYALVRFLNIIPIQLADIFVKMIAQRQKDE